MAKKIQLSIADPCHENWGNMTQAEQGRFCASCQKQVVDFSGMSDRQVLAFFRKPSAGSVCGRFYNDQLDRDIEIPRKRIPWLKYFFQFALPAFLVSVKATAQGKVKTPAVTATESKRVGNIILDSTMFDNKTVLMGDTIGIRKALEGRMGCGIIQTGEKIPDHRQLVKPTSQLISDGAIIKGRVIDNDGQPVPFTTVVIKGTTQGVLANAAGEFMLNPGKDWEEVILVVSYVGFSSTELKVINEKPAVNVVVQIRLEPAVMGEVAVVGFVVPKKPKKRPKPIPVLTQKLMDTSFKFFKVFPNPVSSGSSLNIEWKKAEEGYYTLELFDLSGKKIYSRVIWMDTEARLLNLEIPAVAPGNYLLKATHNESKRNFTEKIIVQ